MREPEQPKTIEIDMQKLEEILRRAEECGLAKEDIETIRAIIDSYRYISQLIEEKNISLDRLRRLLFGARTEKTAAVVGRDQHAPQPPQDAGAPADGARASPPTPASGPGQSPAAKKPGHGRNGADDFPGAVRVSISHESLRSGDSCPVCIRGTVYTVATPGVLIRLVGQPPVQATIYELQKLRCNLCGTVFTARVPEEAGAQKYDPTVGSLIGLLKYGTGMPFHRLEGLQRNLGVPLAASTQWEIVSGSAVKLQPAFDELVRQAAQGEIVQNDDTTVKILQLMGARAKGEEGGQAPAQEGGEGDMSGRTGLFTSGVVATRGGQRIALFFSGRQHGGENLVDVLRRRAAELPPPIQMCDALSRNMPQALRTIVANCLAHGRRQFADVHDVFPNECRYVLEVFEVVYRNDAKARQEGMSAAERLAFHQRASGPVMEDLRAWLQRQFDERLVEPNSGLGAAIQYLRNHWEKLTLFLRVAGAPLDNNLCERALKRAILHRKNALFYKTQNGANVGDLHMSLIHTCELNGVNPLDYLTELQLHAEEVAAAPQNWMPWNYRAHLAAAGHSKSQGVAKPPDARPP
jgi:hypothetical protein